MDKEIVIELIHIAPVLFWTVVLFVLLIRFRTPLGDLLSRIGRVKAFGVEAEFAQQAREQLIRASKSYNHLSPNESEVQSVIARADRIRDMMDGSRILWVDDTYLANANIFRFLNAYGVMIDKASTTYEAMAALRWASGAYEVVVSDMKRGDEVLAGLDLISRMQAEQIQKQIILFVAKLDPTKGTPPGAVAITDNPIKLIHHIMNALETGN